MCLRDRPTLAIKQIGIISVVVDRPKQIFVVITARSHPGTIHIPHREIRRVDLRDNLRQHVALLPDQRGGDPVQRRAPGRPDPRGVALQTVSKNSSPAALILPPVSMKGTKLL